MMIRQRPFVASFVGENNVFRGKVKSISKGFAVIDTNRTGRLRAGLQLPQRIL